MRDLNDVILELLDIIPIEESDLRQALSVYLNIESSPDDWNEVGDILYTYVFSDFYPEISWQAEAERIWTGDEDTDLLDYSNF